MSWQTILLGFILGVVFLTFFYYQDFKKIPRGLILAIVVIIEITILCFFWNKVESFVSEGKCVVWLKRLLPIVLAAVPAYLLWSWRDANRRKELQHQADKLKLKENDEAIEAYYKKEKVVKLET